MTMNALRPSTGHRTMKSTMMKRSVSCLALGASALFGTAPAFAQTADPAPAADAGAVDCAAAYESAQTERQAGHFRAASNQAMLCSQSTCNQAIVRECIALFESIQAEMPSMVFSARRADGGELTNVRIEMDGQPLLDQLDGKALALDPGAHTFKFFAEGFDPKEIQHTARVGDRNRLIEVVFGELPPPATGAAPGTGAPPPAAKSERGVPVASYVLAGVGVVGLGVFGYMRISGVQDYNELNQKCSPECDPSEVEPIRSKFQYSYIALGVGAAALAAATVVYFTVPGGDDDATSAQVGFGATPSGAEARLRARF
jgi:hypothetical protein